LNIKRYYIITFILAFIASPIVVTVGIIAGSMTGMRYMSVVITILLLCLMWFLRIRSCDTPESVSKLLLPIFAAYAYYMLIWVLVYGFSKYHFDSILFTSVFPIATFPYFFINFMLAFGRDYNLFPAIISAITIISIITICLSCVGKKRKIKFNKSILAYILIFASLSGIAIFQYYDRTTKVFSNDKNVQQVNDEVDLYEYQPFSANNLLKKLKDNPTISISDNYPKLDGATAAYPVYGAIAQEIYKGLDEKSVGDYVSCTKTSEAYTHLINGDIDIFFGAQPSKQQLKMAEAKGVKLELTPIAKEAFVFFVNKDNPIDNLTLEELQDIYQKKITNWNELGGKNEKILPFQRPENSGSQTIMLAKVMNGKTMPAPLWEEYSSGMGEIISQTAAYRNYTSAIGYSFRYFATGMKPNNDIKILKINGIAPSTPNIREKKYPFTVDVYAVTAGSKNPNTNRLIQWILTEQGQQFIETCGYIRH
jgi:phosphate transport system substrate-binding protein